MVPEEPASFSQPRRRMSLFSLGATLPRAIEAVSSMRRNRLEPGFGHLPQSMLSRQWARVLGGVRKLDVQLTVSTRRRSALQDGDAFVLRLPARGFLVGADRLRARAC